jgi:outer membrane protein TolC
LACGAAALPAAAQAPESEAFGDELRLSLADAVERALSSSPALRQASALEASATAGERLARSGRWPQVNLSLGYARRSDVPELTIPQPTGAPRTIFPNIPNSGRARLQAVLPLYTGGRLGGVIEASGEERAAAGKDAARQRLEVILETRRAYWSLVTAREAARVLSEALVAYDAHLTDARSRESVGMAARNEVLAVEVERDRAELARLRAENAAAIADANLRRLLGLSGGAPRIEPTEPLESALPALEDIEALVTRAIEERPERAALEARVAAAGARARAEGAARLPQLAALAGYDYARPNSRILPLEARWQDSWDAGVSLSWSVFDGGRTSAAVARARARVEALRAQLDGLTRAIRLDVTRSALEVTAAGKALDVAARHLDAARENQRVAADRYREGLIPSSERLDAEVALQRAGLDRLQSLAESRLALAELDHALGR